MWLATRTTSYLPKENAIKLRVLKNITNQKKKSQYIRIEILFISNLTRPACASKQDRLVLATIREAKNKFKKNI